MMRPGIRGFTLPREAALGIRRIGNATGLSIGALPHGGIFSIEHRHERDVTMVNQVLGSPIAGGIGRISIRRLSPERAMLPATGPEVVGRFGAAADRFVWELDTGGLRRRVILWLAPGAGVWLWRVEIANRTDAELTCDALLVQDLGLGDRGFVMGNEAFASQYIDHFTAAHPRFGPVVMSRQNLSQDGRHPWLAQGCLDGAAGFATDAMQLFGPAFRDAAEIDPADPPDEGLQHEVACPVIRSRPVRLPPAGEAAWTFFALYDPDHAEASGPADLARLDTVERSAREFRPVDVPLSLPARSLVQDAPPAVAAPLGENALARLYPERLYEEWAGGRLLSFFAPEGAGKRHVVLRDKERMVPRRHGALLRSGRSMLPDEAALCATCWMHGVFGAQLTIGNTSLHKLLSVSRDPYNITRASGLRILVDAGAGWRLLTVPSAFEMGLADCRWLYRLGDRTVLVEATVSGDEAAMQWRISVEGPPCRFLLFGHLVLGERELEQAGSVEIDAPRRRVAFRPDPESLWGERYPDAVFHMVTSSPGAVEAIGGDELLYADGRFRGGPYAAIRTRSTAGFSFAVVGCLADPVEAERLADRYAGGVGEAAMLAPAAEHWHHVTRGLRITGAGAEIAALDTILPWFAHDAMMHLTVPHGLEQHDGAAWGTRDVCQGPIEFLLALEHDGAAKDILRRVFARQHPQRGDWPQWFMLDPYAEIQDPHSHGDVIIWPLKALCDYVEATGDLAFLDEPIAWGKGEGGAAQPAPIAAHVDKLLAAVRERFVPGTHLLRYGEGDWNDSLQPADPALRERMVSSWTVALLFQQLNRYAEVLRRAGQAGKADGLAGLAASIRADFNRHLVRDGVVAAYLLTHPDGPPAELLLHPRDRRTGVRYSLLPMTRSIIAGLFTPEQAQRHLGIIREHLLFPDGVRLMDRPIAYAGGVERLFRRAESAAFFGREIGLMYVHAHLRYGEAMAALGEADALWEALQLVNPILVADRLPHASPRQRNAYFSSSDAAFRDRRQASAEWDRVKAGDIAVDGGWRIYSSGPGIYTDLVLRHLLGIRRDFGHLSVEPLLPAHLDRLTVELTRGETRTSISLGGRPDRASIHNPGSIHERP